MIEMIQNLFVNGLTNFIWNDTISIVLRVVLVLLLTFFFLALVIIAVLIGTHLLRKNYTVIGMVFFGISFFLSIELISIYYRMFFGEKKEY